MSNTNNARRTFIKNSALLAVPLVGASLPVFAAVRTGGAAPAESLTGLTTPPTRTRGTTVLNVKNYGALGNGTKDDTAAIQAAINALPTTGGTVQVPAGTYIIDTSKKINLRSKMHLQMMAGAIFKAKTSSLSRHYLVYINDKSDVEISGGQFIGDRATHVYSGGGTHEWGHGIQCLGGVRVTIRDLRVADCTGDGVCMGGGANDVVVANIVSTNNRRQGISVTNCSNIKVYDSEFSFTNGTAPECGIDIEPDAGYSCKDVLLQNCRFNDNKKYGANIWNRTTNVTFDGCTFERNGSLGMGTVGIAGLTVKNCTFRLNSATGVVYNTATTGCTHSNNLSYQNYTRLGAKVRTPFSQTGWSSKIERDVLIRGGAVCTIGTNNFQ